MRRRLARAAPWLGALIVAGVQYRFLFTDLMQCSRDLYGQHFEIGSARAAGRRRVALVAARRANGSAVLRTDVHAGAVPPAGADGPARRRDSRPQLDACVSRPLRIQRVLFAGRRLGLSRSAAFISAASFGLGPAFVVFSQNLQFAASASWAGWSLWAALRVRASPEPRRLAVLALTLGGGYFPAGAPEMVLWQGILVVLVCGFRGVIACAWSGVAGAVVLLPAAELAREYTRPGAAPSGQLEWSTSFAQPLVTRCARRRSTSARRHLGDLGSVVLGVAVRRHGRGDLRGSIGESKARETAADFGLRLCGLLALGRNFVLAEALLLPVSSFRYPRQIHRRPVVLGLDAGRRRRAAAASDEGH